MSISRPKVNVGRGDSTALEKPTRTSRFSQRLAGAGDEGRSWGARSRQGVLSLVALLVFWLGGIQATFAQTAVVDLSLTKAFSNQNPALGDVITYSVVVTNAANATAAATNVVVTDLLLTEGATYVPSSASTSSGTYTAAVSSTVTTGTWRIPSIAPGASATLTFRATVVGRGVWFNTAEVTSLDQTDPDSPASGNIYEDDYAAVCFAIPIFFYAGDEYTVSIPAGFDRIEWFRNDVPISTSAVSTSLAVVNNDNSLTIKSVGVYRFVTYKNECASSNCCNIEFVPGPLGSLGNFVWEDKNANGKQDADEPGISGVTVELYNQTSTTLLASTTTTVGGLYSFTGLTDGSYTVKFVTPAGFQPTSQTATGVSDDMNSDAGLNGLTRVYTIDTSQPESSTARNNPTVDAGFIKPASLGNYVFADNDRNGVQSPGDTPISGVTVNLLLNGTVVATTTTDASGLYSFTGLTPGLTNVYSVSFTAPAGLTATTPRSGTDNTIDSDADLVTGLSGSVTLTSGETNTTIDAGYQRLTAGLGDYVWEDKNANGQQDAGEPPISGVTVSLRLNGLEIATTTTNASGFYSFTGLTPGSTNVYSVSFSTPTGFSGTVANIGPDATDSDANPSTGVTGSYTLAANEFNTTVDAGFIKPASLGNYVFADNDRNGVQSPGDTPISGVTVNLLLNGTVVATTTTDASGLYSFTGLTPGLTNVYSVSFTAPAGLTATTPRSGTDNTIDSDADLVTGLSGSVTLTSGETNTTIDAGYLIPTSGLGDYVWADLNSNGVQDAGEPGIAGVVATLFLNGQPTSQTVLTSSTGFYSFTGLTPGSSNSYAVGFSTPTGFTATTPLSGPNRSLDSDLLATGRTGSVTLASGEFNPSLDAGFVPGYDVGIEKLVVNPKGSYLPGDLITYRLVVTNNSAYPVYNVVVTDQMPAGVSFVSGSGLVSSGPNSTSGTIAGPLVASGSVSLTYTAQISNTYSATSIANVAVVGPFTSTSNVDGYKPRDSNPANNTATTTVPVGSFAGLGDYVWADLNSNGVQDAGEPGIAGVVATLFLNGQPTSQTVLTSSTGFYSFTGLTPGSSNSYAVGFSTPTGFTATTPLSGPNRSLDSDLLATGRTGSVTLASGEFNPSLDAGFVPGYDVGIAKTVAGGRSSFTAGDVVTYELRVTNNSAYPVYNVVVNDLLPASMSFVSGTGFATSGANSVSTVIAGPLAANGGTTSLTLSAQISAAFAGGSLTNIAVVSPYTSVSNVDGYRPVDTNPVNNTASVPVTVGGMPAMAIVVAPAICNTATNGYVTTGTVSFTNIIPGVLTITENGSPIASYTVTAGQTSVSFSLTGISNGPASRTVTATLAGVVNLIKSTTYAVPVSCTLCQPITLTPSTLVAGVKGIAYSQTLVATGGTAPYTYAVVAGSLPLGLTLDRTTGVLSGTPTTAGVSNFTVVATDAKSCLVTVSYSLSIGTGCPDNFNLTASADASICNGESTTLVASTPVPGAKIRWYLTPYDGVAIATLASGEPLVVNPTTTTVYYVEATTEGCASPRKPVVVTVTTVPTPICLGNIKNTCPKTTVDLTTIEIENHSTGLTYEWYTSLTRSEATRVTNTTAVGAGKYYLFAKSGRCYSNPTVLTVEIVDCNCQSVAGVNVGPGVSICSGDGVPVKAVLSGSATSIVWSTNGTGTFSSPTSLSATYTPSAADIANGSVMLTATTNDPDGAGVCKAATSSLMVAINKRPDMPVGVACDDTLVCQGSSTKLIGFAPGARINWYDQSNRLVGTTESGGKLVVTPATAGQVVYTAEAVSPSGCVSPRASLTITVGTCLPDLALTKAVVTAGPYKVGQKITYSLTASNNGPIAGADVKVKDVLPPTLTFVSATPAAEYNAATSTWTIGTLTKGSNRSLLIEATINAGGTITNTGIISGSNNDPRYAVNDTARATIDVSVCSAEPPVIVCALTEICKGSSTTLVARGCEGGTVRWSDQQTGFSVVVTPSVTTTYSASCVLGQACISGRSNLITVTVRDPQPPVITASADQVCPGTSVTLTASGCEGGKIEWSERAQTGSVIVVEPTTRTTYTAQCVIGSCPGKPATKTIDISTGLPTPTITCSTTIACPGEEVTLTVNGCVGTPVWSSTTLTTGSIVVRPSLGSNSYSVYCKSNGCQSEPSKVYSISVVPALVPTVTASADTACAGAPVSLTASGCNGTVIWNVAGTDGNSLTGSVITVRPTASMRYYAQCRYRTCLSEPSNAVPVTIVNPQAPQISLTSGKNLICSGEKVTLTAEGCEGTVKWYGIDRVGASISFFPTETKEYFATCKQGNCESDRSLGIRVTVTTSGTVAPPTIVASTTSICGSGLVSLTATGCSGGTITWSDGQTGSVVSVSATPTQNEFYAICTATSGSACGSSRSNTIKVSVTAAPQPIVTCSTDHTCPGEEVTLTVTNCMGTPMWSTGQTTTSIIVSPTVTTGYSLYCQDGKCRSPQSATYTITVTPVPTPTIVASATVVEPGGTVSLTAIGCTGDVIWSANDINGNNMGNVIVVRPNGAQTYYAQCRYRTCLSNPSNTIIVNSGSCVAKAGTLVPVEATICSGTAIVTTLAARPNGGLVQPAGYSVLYVLTKGADLVIQQTSTTPTFSVTDAAGSYTIHTLVYNATPNTPNYFDLSVVRPGLTTGGDVVKLIAERKLCADLDVTGARINVRRVAPPVISPNKPFTVCAGSAVTFTATGCEGGTIRWTNGDEGASITKTIVSDLWVMATCTIDGCTSNYSNMGDAVVNTPNVPTISADRMVACKGERVTLTATGCEGGQYIWSDNVTTGSSLSFIATADVSYRVKCMVGECSSAWSPYTTIKAGAPDAPTISVAGGTSTTACFGAPVTLVAQGCPAGSYVTWSNNQVGSTMTVSLATTQTYTARCCTSDNCKSEASNAVTVTVLPKVAQPKTVDKTNTCPINTVDLTTAVTSQVSTRGGVFEFYTSQSLSAASKVTNTAVGAGTYYVVEKTIDGCYSLPVAIHVNIIPCAGASPCDPQNPATANAGADASICAAKTYQLAGVMGGAGRTAHWTTSGTGTFDNSFQLNATYTASAEDIASGKVTLTLSVSTNNAACAVAKDEMVLTIQGSKTAPAVQIVGSTNLCYGDSVKLVGPQGASGYIWSTKERSSSIVVKTSGTYTLQVVDGSGCSSAFSEPVVVKVAEPAPMPLVANVRNNCPSVVANLTSALSATTAGSTYEYRIGQPAWSKLITRPDSVGAGTYYVFARSSNGCVSAPAKVVVSIFNCATDTVKTDLSISKLASVSAVQHGEPVTYTIKVTNNGLYTAKNIDVRDVLPQGLELVVSGATSFSVSNGVITKRIDSLQAGKSESISFQARLVAKGTVVNTATITYFDQKDTNLANNTASATVTNNAAYKPSQIGLAKSVLGTPKAEGDSLIKVSYRFVATNFGDDTLRKVQVVDDLAFFFAPNKLVSAVVKPEAGSTLKPLATFTGAGSNVDLLDPVSYIAPGRSQLFTMDVVVRRAAGDTTRGFINIASATALNGSGTVTDLSTTGGDSDPDGDGDPTNNSTVTSFTLGGGQPQGPGIGLALVVAKIEPKSDNSYTITYKATIKNLGDVDLTGISLTDSLVRAFAPPVSYTVVGTKVGAGSKLVLDANYDGNTYPNVLAGTSKLAAGEQDTVLIVVNVKLNGNNGPFFSSATVTGQTTGTGQTVSDISNDGLDPVKPGAVSTPVRFDLPAGLLGVAKQAGEPVAVSEGVFDIPYTITLKNCGTVPLTNVQVVDNLSETFGNGALIVSSQISVSAGAGLTVNPQYTGQGLVTNMLIDSLSSLGVGESRSLAFIVRVDARNADSLTFYNTAKATAMTPDKKVVEDQSTTGPDDDPDKDLDPRNNSAATPVILNNLSSASYIGLAMSVRDTVRQADQSFNVVYQVVVKNYGRELLKKVTVSDTLSKVFNNITGASYKVVSAPVTISTGSTLKLNPAFDGSANPLLVLGDSTSTLAAGKVDTILFVVNVSTFGSTTTFLNTAYAEAISGTDKVSDISTNGLNPDVNGNNNPTDLNEREATPLNLPATSTALFIPEGFSPNGDGVNDLFVIRGTGAATISLEVYNRWGHLVYNNDDYRNDWDGKPNAGTVISDNAAGVPDGTYYYVINLSDGRKFVRYMTINR